MAKHTYYNQNYSTHMVLVLRKDWAQYTEALNANANDKIKLQQQFEYGILNNESNLLLLGKESECENEIFGATRECIKNDILFANNLTTLIKI